MEGVKVIKSSAYHPQGNGKAERWVKTVKQKLVRMLADPVNFDSDWDQYPLHAALYAARSSYSQLHANVPIKALI